MNLLKLKGKKTQTIQKTVITEILDNKQATYGPKYVVIDITNKCNLNCIACWTYSPLLDAKKPSPQWFNHQLSFETIKTLVKDLKAMHTDEIRLTGGGEPFMHLEIMQIIALIKKNNFKLDITTNFTLADKQRLSSLVDLGLDNLTVSLWAATPETYATTHPNQKKKTFHRIKKHLLYFNSIKNDTKVVIANVISNLNYHEIEDMMQFAKQVRANEVYFTMVDPVEKHTDSLLLNKTQQNDLRQLFARVHNNYRKGKYDKVKIDNPHNFLRRIRQNTSQGRYDSNVILELPCTIGWTFSRIMANGDVAPCCRSVMLPTGNINKQNFKNIWNGHKQTRFRGITSNLRANLGFMKKVGCAKTCDNVMHNKEMYDRIKSIF